MLPWETMTIVAHWETVATMPPSWFIPFIPQWQTISRRTSMTNRFTHSTHDEPFHRCYKWQTISPVLPKTNHCTNVIYEKKNHQSHAAIRNHCNHATITNHFTQTTHDKLFYLLLSIRQLISPIPHMKRHWTHVPMTNHCNYAIIRKPFSHTTISSILSWQITSTMPLMTNHFTSSIPENHGSYSTRTNHFTDSIHDTPFIRN